MKLYELYNKKFGTTMEQIIDNLRQQGINRRLFAYTVRGRRFRFMEKEYMTETLDGHEAGGADGLAGYTGTGVLCQAGIQDGIGNGVSHLVGMAVGNTFGGKQSFFHLSDSFLYSSKNQKRTHRRFDVCYIESSSFVAAGFGTIA